MSVEGSWKISLDTPMGLQTGSISIAAEAGSYTGTVTACMGSTATMEEITVDGNRIDFKATLSTPMGKMRLGLGATVDGDAMSGNM